MMKITACPKCGSKDIQMGGIGEGVLFGITSWKQVCKKCGYQGAPLVFDSEKEYKKFVEELQNDEDKKPNEDDVKLSKKEKEVIEFLHDLDEEDKKDEISKEESEVHSRWNIFLISAGLSVIITLLTIPYFLSQFDVVTSIFSIIGRFIVTLFLVFVLVLFVRFLLKGAKIH